MNRLRALCASLDSMLGVAQGWGLPLVLAVLAVVGQWAAAGIAIAKTLGLLG